MPQADKKQTAHITNPRHPILIVVGTSSVTTRPPRTAQEEDEEDFFSLMTQWLPVNNLLQKAGLSFFLWWRNSLLLITALLHSRVHFTDRSEGVKVCESRKMCEHEPRTPLTKQWKCISLLTCRRKHEMDPTPGHTPSYEYRVPKIFQNECSPLYAHAQLT